MNQFESVLRSIDDDLGRLGRSFAVVGGLAVSVRAEPRLTRDADLVVAVADDPDAEQLVRSLVALGYLPTMAVEQEAVGRLATIRLQPDPGDGMTVIDLLFASSGIEHEIVDAAERLLVLPELVLPIAATGHLIVMKLLARDDRSRPADADDLRALAEVATDDDWDVAADAAELVMARGFHRGRDLVAALEALRADGPY